MVFKINVSLWQVMENDSYLNENKCWEDLSGTKRYTEGDAF